jgi:hypothetical protein
MEPIGREWGESRHQGYSLWKRLVLLRNDRGCRLRSACCSPRTSVFPDQKRLARFELIIVGRTGPTASDLLVCELGA